MNKRVGPDVYLAKPSITPGISETLIFKSESRQQRTDGASSTMGEATWDFRGTLWHQQLWVKGEVMENDKFKLMWDFEYKLIKYNKARRPDLTPEDRVGKRIWLLDIACCPQEQNIEEKHWES